MLLMAIGALDGWQPLLILLAVLIPAGIWLAALVDILRSRFKKAEAKLIWLLVITLIPVIGVLLYIFLGREQKVN